MKKSIGGKIAVVLSTLALIFVIAMGLNIIALFSILDLNSRTAAYMKIQQEKTEISVAFGEEMLCASKVYVNQKAEEVEVIQAEMLPYMSDVTEKVNALSEHCAKTKNAAVIETFTAWQTALQEYEAAALNMFEVVKGREIISSMKAVDGLAVIETQVREAEEAFNSQVYSEQLANMKSSAGRIDGSKILAIVVTLVFFIVIIFALVIILKTVAAPAKKTRKALDEIVSNIQNNEGDLTERVPVETVDEIGQMSEGINSFIEELQQIMQKLKEDSVSLMASAEMVEAKIEASNESANNVSATTEEMSASMEEISATLAQVAEGNASILVDVRSMSEKAAGGAQLVEEIKERAKGIYATTLEDKEKASSMMEEIRISLQQAVEESKSVERIRELTSEILSITNQTNLLSLNASIEAARAGEAGRGFAVVAGEISHLADNSRETANNIQNISEMVTAAVEKLAQNAEYVLEFIDEKVMTDYDGFVDVASQYEKDADDMNSILQDFATNSSTINDTMLSLNEGIESVHTAMDENARGVTDVAENVVGLVEAIAQIQQETETNVDISRKLGEEVQRFKNV